MKITKKIIGIFVIIIIFVFLSSYYLVQNIIDKTIPIKTKIETITLIETMTLNKKIDTTIIKEDLKDNGFKIIAPNNLECDIILNGDNFQLLNHNTIFKPYLSWKEWIDEFDIPENQVLIGNVDMDFKVIYQIKCNSLISKDGNNLIITGKEYNLLLNFEMLTREYFEAEYNKEREIISYIIKPQAYNLNYNFISNKLVEISVELKSKYKNELDNKKLIVLDDKIVLDPTYEIIDVTLDANLNNVICEGAGKFCHLNISDKDLVFYMPFDVENVTTIVYDWSENNNDGTLGNEPNWVTGKFGGAFVFDGSDDYIEVANSNSLSVSNITVSFWLKPTNTISGYDNLITYWDASQNNWAIYFQTTTQTLRFYSEDLVGKSFDSLKTDWSAGQWYFVAITYNGSAVSHYVNGGLDRTPQSTSGDFSGTTSPLGIGCWNTALGTNVFNGAIDEVMIFNRSLLAIEISDIYTNSFARFHPLGNLTINQTIDSGYDRVNVTINNSNQNITNISLKIYDGTSWTDYQNMSNATETEFIISSSATNLNLSFLHISDFNQFWSPILEETIFIETWTIAVIKDTVFPNITMIFPIDNYNTSIISINLTANFSDNINLSNISMYMNNTLNKTFLNIAHNYSQTYNFSINLTEGLQNYTFNTCDNSSNCINSSTKILTLDTIIPMINSTDLGINQTSPINFNFTVLDTNLIHNCSLFINGTGNIFIRNGTPLLNPVRDTIINFTRIIENGTYIYGYECVDFVGNLNVSINRTLIINETHFIPTSNINISLIYPLDNTNQSNVLSIGINFTYNVTSHITLDNCSLVINGSINQTDNSVIEAINQSMNVTLMNSTYAWNITCWDILERQFNGTDNSWTLIVNETHFVVPPVPSSVNITLISPPDNTNVSNPINFTYNVSSYYDLSNCSLIINGSINLTDEIVIKNLPRQNITTILENSTYAWNISCWDNQNKRFNVSDWSVIINETHFVIIDITAPTWDKNGTNVTRLTTTGDIPEFSIEWTDETELSQIMFSWNDTNNWLNASNITARGLTTLNYSVNMTITLEERLWIYYMFFANDSSNNWNETDKWYFQVADITPPHNITDLANTTTGITNITINWTNSTDVNYMLAEIRLDGIWKINTTNHNYTFLDLTGSTTYNIGVLAYDDWNNSLNWTNITVTTMISPDEIAPMINISYPANLTIYQLRDFFTIGFNVTDNIDDEMDCKTYFNGTLMAQNTATKNNTLTNFTITDLEKREHYWNISCTDDGGNIGWSETRIVNIEFVPLLWYWTREYDNKIMASVNEKGYINQTKSCFWDDIGTICINRTQIINLLALI